MYAITENCCETMILFYVPVKSSFEKHQEDDNLDFDYERNIPEMLSREGPKAAVGDVNGDGLPDIYIGGTKVNPGNYTCKQRSGQFVKKTEPVFDEYTDFEDEAFYFLM